MLTKGKLGQIQEIINAASSVAPNRVFWNLKAKIITPEGAVNTTSVGALRGTCDYVKDFGEYKTIEVTMGLVTFLERVSPFEQELKVMLTYRETTKDGIVINGGDVKTETYKAYLFNNPGKRFRNERRSVSNPEEEQLFNHVPVVLQLIDETLDVHRKLFVRGSPRGHTVEELMLYYMSPGLEDNVQTANLKLRDYKGFRGVQMIKPDNVKKYAQIPIPETTKLVNFPLFLQNSDYGVYSTGLGRFYHNGLWYIYPLFNHKRFKKEEQTMTIVIIPPDQQFAVENSAYVKGGHITILCGGQLIPIDVSEKTWQNDGNAVNFYSPSDIFNNIRDMDNGVATAKADAINKQFVIHPNKAGDVTFNYPATFTENVFKETSKVAAAMGTQLVVVWQNAIPEYVYPGMPIRLIHQGDESLVETYGTVLGKNYITASPTGNFNDEQYVTNMSIVIHVEKYLD